MKVAIIRNAPSRIKKLMAAQFPEDWEIVTVPADELENAIGDAVAIIPEGAAIDRRVLAQAPRLKFIQTGAGYDNIDIEACTESGIYVANAAGVNARAVAEHVFAFILSWYKNIIALDGALKHGEFSVDYAGSELSEKAIGVVGLGNIGREVCRLAAAFHMKVIGYHHRRTETIPDTDVVEWHTLLRQSDIITIHVSLNSQTRHLIGQKEFGSMKNDVFFINTSRGGVVDEATLIESLRNQQIGGAGLDVFDTEPLPAESPLRKLNNVILSPHNAGEPDGLFFHKKRFQFFADNIFRVLKGKPPRNALNDPVGQSIEPDSRISQVILPEGYNGKILLVSVSGNGIENAVLLRSGDMWHREILRNTEVEIKNLGFENALVHQLGGAHVRFEPDGTIIIYGASQEFGACAKEYAAELVRVRFPGRRVAVSD
jgi:phosphoglycerate dehydrogenase-like enzyme